MSALFPRRKQYSYDACCEELARHFGDNPDIKPLSQAEVRDLAQDIQNAVEDWFFSRDSLQ